MSGEVKHCDECGRRIGDADWLTHCDDCSHTVCQECIEQCGDCSGSYCPDCIEGGLCNYCAELREQDELDEALRESDGE